MPSSSRYIHPPHLLKHRYIPTAAENSVNGRGTAVARRDEDLMNDMSKPESIIPLTPQSAAKPHKKRKIETDGTEEKKSKKSRKEK